MNRKIPAFALLTVLLALLVPAGQAAATTTAPAVDPEATATAAGPIASFLRCLGVVGLTDQQKADTKAILEAAKPAIEGLVAQLAADGKALKALVDAGKDPCAIGAAVLKVGADEKALKAAFVKIGTSIEALLTLEQKAKFQGCLAGLRPPTAASTDPSAE
jgi:Spy/CpxP family protein refolding chaperone